MDYSKELLLFVATTLVSAGATVIASDILAGTGLLVLGALVFVGRGFYKKYLGDKEKKASVNN